MNNPELLVDAEARLTAETTFDRNVVVLAGAGTGKTTLLVNRVIHALLRKPHSFRLTEILALTFTNKAAKEMKERLRECLQGLLNTCEVEARCGDSTARLHDFRQRYHLSTEQIKEKLELSLDDLEKAQIATLHSFAAHLLRLYPLESRVDPLFQEDDGTHFGELFEETWSSWLEEELGPHGSAHAQWQEVLSFMSLKDIQAFAFSLSQDQISLSHVQSQVGSREWDPAFREWVRAKQQQVRQLIGQYQRAQPRKIEKMLVLAGDVFTRVEQAGWSNGPLLSESDAALLGSAIGKAPGDWESLDFQKAKRVIQAATRLLQVNETILHHIIHVLAPFVERVRQVFSDKGWIRFDGLLIRVRDLLRDHPLVREQLKTTYHAILIDEFQDTDPVQYEILLYLGECPGEHCRLWRDIRLVPGKLFIVGDPKQSIYAFRRADIEAFDLVVDKVIRENGLICTLLTNFRSDGAILDTINAIFDRLFLHQANVQPPNVPLAVGRIREAGMHTTGVEAFVMANQNDEEEWDAERATRLEAEWLAGWIQDQLRSGKQTIVEKGVRGPLRPGHIAVLFRKFTNAQIYLEALQRHHIPYLTDGERHFYRRQEIIDMVNVLRVMDDPTDAVALAGILRSSLGGLKDQEIMEVAKLSHLDIRQFSRLEAWENPRRPAIRSLFQRLVWLHTHANRIPLSELLDHLFAQLPLIELAAASSHGEQAVVNVWKLRDLMSTQAALPQRSFSAWVDRLVESLLTHPPEPEAPLAEDTLEAVRVLTIHKAKGLEFPVVLLPGLHQKAARNEQGADIAFDWVSGLYGCTLPPVWNAHHLPLWEKQQIRENAEQRRVLYVGMTRARDRLILSGGLLAKRGGESVLNLLQQIAEGEFGHPEQSSVTIGAASIPQTVVTPEKVLTHKFSKLPSEPQPSAKRVGPTSLWAERSARWQQVAQTIAYLTPSSLHQEKLVDTCRERQPSIRANGRQLGILLHRLLQGWDFQCPSQNFREPLAEFCQRHLLCDPEEGAKEMLRELDALLDVFLQSPAYRELQRANILGREVPFTVPWPATKASLAMPQPCVMEGVMDVVYELDGEVWIGDYKTDQISASTIRQRAEAYREQAYAYAIAANRCLGSAVKGCKLFFIRLGEVVRIEV